MWIVLLFTWFTLASPSNEGDPAKVPVPAAAPEAAKDPAATAAPPVAIKPVAPAAAVVNHAPEAAVDWSGLTRGSLRFLGVMHGFRLLTEPGTRSGGFGLGSGYTQSVGNLHGWADGDPFYVNYVGHPMQGAVSGQLWQLHDGRYRRAEFGRSPEYWKARLRGAAFAWAFSEQFEIGPFSEASIGHIQRDFPQQGFVDHAVTPTIGLSWTIAEDALDRYVVRSVEDRTYNRYVRILVRSVLNPARTFANLMDQKPPWYRSSREGVLAYNPSLNKLRSDALSGARGNTPTAADDRPAAAPWEVTPATGWREFGGKPCVGGGAEAAWRMAPDWQLALNVSGCKMLGLGDNVSGDALLYQAGPRWTPSAGGKWSPYAHLLIGGLKVTQERLDPVKKRAVLAANQNLDPALDYTLHEQYTTAEEANGLALTAGVGIDYKLNSALALRVLNLEYLRSQLPAVGGVAYNQGFQMHTGIVLRLGTW